MSLRLLDHSPDLRKLRDSGYEVTVESGYLVVRNVPYVGDGRAVKRGILASDLTLAGDVTVRPSSHTVYFQGDFPLDKHGVALESIRHQTAAYKLTPDLEFQHIFSNKPTAGYADYFEKITTYIALIANEAAAIDPRATARTHRVTEGNPDDSVFCYLDTASSRAEIVETTRRLQMDRVAIVGLGGTGSYVLDLLAKTPIGEIHLFDGDELLTHNAFRAPGAPSLELLRTRPKKVEYFGDIYSNMRRGILTHPYDIDEASLDEISTIDFVFLCLDQGEAKFAIIRYLEKIDKPFIDVGMGLYTVDGKLAGIARVVTSTPKQRGHVWEKQRIPFTKAADADLYSKNIQVADLNALNAALAVVKWKKLCGYYNDLSDEYYCAYTIDGNRLANDDVPVKSD